MNAVASPSPERRPGAGPPQQQVLARVPAQVPPPVRVSPSVPPGVSRFSPEAPLPVQEELLQPASLHVQVAVLGEDDKQLQAFSFSRRRQARSAFRFFCFCLNRCRWCCNGGQVGGSRRSLRLCCSGNRNGNRCLGFLLFRCRRRGCRFPLEIVNIGQITAGAHCNEAPEERQEWERKTVSAESLQTLPLSAPAFASPVSELFFRE